MARPPVTGPSPADLGFAMPPEWAPHARTWMAWPTDNYVRSEGHPAVAAWAGVAATVARFEPVTMVVNASDESEARAALPPSVDVEVLAHDDAWMRDSGPTFLLDGDGRLGAACWTFNGWGAQPWASWAQDALVGAAVAGRAGAQVFRSPLVNEGGGICVDGDGTVLVTDTVQLHDRRNPGWSRAEAEDELRRMLGVSTVVWLATGLTADMQGYGTNGHVDVMAMFVRPGVIAVHEQPDPSHPDHEVMAENVGRLRAARDAHGRAFELVPVPAPPGDEGDGSYLNGLFVNGGLVVGTFGDVDADSTALSIFSALLPDREVVGVPAGDIFAKGGGVHCITQQQPASN